MAEPINKENGQYSYDEYSKLIDKVDSLIKSPHDRAKMVWDILKNQGQFDTWDIVSFCSWFLSWNVPSLPFLKEYALTLDKQIHHIHYQAGHQIGLYKLEDVNKNELRKDDKVREEGPRVSRDYSPE